MLNETCGASFLNRGGIELEIGRKLPTRKAVPTTYQDHVRTTEQGERRRRKERRRGKSRVVLLWLVNAQESGGPGKLGNASPTLPRYLQLPRLLPALVLPREPGTCPWSPEQLSAPQGCKLTSTWPEEDVKSSLTELSGNRAVWKNVKEGP